MVSPEIEDLKAIRSHCDEVKVCRGYGFGHSDDYYLRRFGRTCREYRVDTRDAKDEHVYPPCTVRDTWLLGLSRQSSVHDYNFAIQVS